eukprot:3005399-Pyramimonas_sp.AAC.1
MPSSPILPRQQLAWIKMSSPGAEAAPGPLCAALLPHASTPSFCTYQYDGGVCRQGIEGHVKLIRSLIQVVNRTNTADPSMCIPLRPPRGGGRTYGRAAV